MSAPSRRAEARLAAFWDARARAAAAAHDEAAVLFAGTVTTEADVSALRDRLERAHLARLLPPERGLRVLDLGAGAGRIGLSLAPHARAVTLVDLSAEQLALAEAHARARGLHNVRFVQGSVLDEPATGPFDLILLLGVAAYLDDAEVVSLADRCTALLAPGGRLIVKEPVTTSGGPRTQVQSDAGLPYRALFRPRAHYAEVFGRALSLRYQRATLAHPFPWFLRGTEGAVAATRSPRAQRLMRALAPLYARLDPWLLAIEERLRAHPRVRRLLAPVEVLQDFYVFDKPRACEVALSVVVIAYDEEACLAEVVGELLAELGRLGASFELVLVDDGSRDGTLAVMRELARRDPRVSVLALGTNRGIGGALRAGFDAARGRHVTWVPADGQIPPSAVRTLFARRDEAPLLTTVYRTRADALHRKLISNTLNALIRVRTGEPAKSGGNYLFARAAWLEHGPRGDDSMMISTAFRKNLRDAGLAIVEVAIDCRPRVAGRSKVLNPRAILRTLGGLARIRR